MTPNPFTRNTAGGWCAPSEVSYDLHPDRLSLEAITPALTVPRGGLTYDTIDSRTPEERHAQEAHHALLERVATQLARQRTAAIDAACITALAHGYDVHVYDPPQPIGSWATTTDNTLHYSTHVGIAFTPAEHPIPTIHHHPAPDLYDYYDDEDWTT